jgi:hypothetical protein
VATSVGAMTLPRVSTPKRTLLIDQQIGAFVDLERPSRWIARSRSRGGRGTLARAALGSGL